MRDRLVRILDMGYCSIAPSGTRTQNINSNATGFPKGGGGGDRIEELREDPPPFMTPIDWNLLLDYYMRDERLQQSNTNRQNRRQAPYPSLHGAKSYVEIRHDAVTHFSLNV